MTMHLFRHTTWIAQPRDKVFDYFLDFSQASRWRSYVRSMEPLDAGPVAAGSRIHVVMDLAGGEYTFDLEVLACDRPALWRHRTNEVDFDGAIEYRFETEREGTRVTMSAAVKPRTLHGWLALPLIWLRRGKAYADQLPQLKRAMEGA
jgi:hypothetical protein